MEKQKDRFQSGMVRSIRKEERMELKRHAAPRKEQADTSNRTEDVVRFRDLAPIIGNGSS